MANENPKDSTIVFPRHRAERIWQDIKDAAGGPVNTYGKYVIELDIQNDTPVHVTLSSNAKYKVVQVKDG